MDREEQIGKIKSMLIGGKAEFWKPEETDNYRARYQVNGRTPMKELT